MLLGWTKMKSSHMWYFIVQKNVTRDTRVILNHDGLLDIIFSGQVVGQMGIKETKIGIEA